MLKGYQDVHGDKDWCYENFINIRNMKHVLVSNMNKKNFFFSILFFFYIKFNKLYKLIYIYIYLLT